MPGSEVSLDVILGLPVSMRGPSYTLVRLLQGMMAEDLRVRLFAPIDRWNGDPTGIDTRTVMSNTWLGRRLPYRLLRNTLALRAEQLLLRRSASQRREGPGLVYTWGETSLALAHKLNSNGVTVVREKFNCAKRLGRDLLDEAYAQLGSTPLHGLTQQLIDKEQEELELADAIFCPSPMVAESLVGCGLSAKKLLPTSYGWEPQRFHGVSKALPPHEGPTLVFVGFVCVRKGAHILLDAWKRAGIKGRLVLVGDIEPLIAERYASTLARADVMHVPYVQDVGAYYRSADWFIFPTLEEGGPQVSYEAGGNGLPVLVSKMGAGAFARDNVEGFVVEPNDVQAWTDLIASLPDREPDRERLGAAARTRAEEFVYEKVGARRRELLFNHFQLGRQAAPATAK